MKLTAFLFCLVVAFASCNVSNKSFSDTAYWIPKDFNPQNSILLIQAFPMSERSNLKMKEFLDQRYPWRYEIAEKDAIMSKTGKYSDTKKYHFAFLWKPVREFSEGRPTGLDENGNFYDRSNGKMYPTSDKSIRAYGNQSYKPYFNSIIKNFQ